MAHQVEVNPEFETEADTGGAKESLSLQQLAYITRIQLAEIQILIEHLMLDNVKLAQRVALLEESANTPTTSSTTPTEESPEVAVPG